MAEKQRIGIIGNGNVGRALKQGFSDAGYDARAAGKDPQKVRDIAEWAEALVLAVPFAQRDEAFEEMGEACNGKCVVDCTNAIGVDGAFVGSIERSGAEDLQQRHSNVRVVKAFNTVFAGRMPDGHAQEEPLTLFVAGEEENDKRMVLQWGRDLGFEPLDSGGLSASRWLEPMAYFNIQLGYQQGLGTDAGFRYVHPRVEQARQEQAAMARSD